MDQPVGRLTYRGLLVDTRGLFIREGSSSLSVRAADRVKKKPVSQNDEVSFKKKVFREEEEEE